jgi:DNA polymerase III subunit epsilon
VREIVLDTETTGLDPFEGHRLVEIGALELFNRFPTGATFHRYVHPERDMPAAAFEVHGLSAEFLKDKPPFAEVADDFLAFIGDAPLIAHNAGFDIVFLNAELERSAKRLISRDRVIDTLILARRKHPAGPNRLDDLCARYAIDNSRRSKHGALLDAEILAEVYVELIGARQAVLGLEEARSGVALSNLRFAPKLRPRPLPPRLNAADRTAHRAFVLTLGPGAIWHDYIAARDAVVTLAKAATA